MYTNFVYHVIALFLDMNDPAIKQFALQVKQKSEFSSLVNNITSDCWDKCITYTLSSLDSKQERCITNCVQRFIDASKVFTQRLGQMESKPQQTAPSGFGSALFN